MNHQTGLIILNLNKVYKYTIILNILIHLMVMVILIQAHDFLTFYRITINAYEIELK